MWFRNELSSLTEVSLYRDGTLNKEMTFLFLEFVFPNYYIIRRYVLWAADSVTWPTDINACHFSLPNNGTKIAQSLDPASSLIL